MVLRSGAIRSDVSYNKNVRPNEARQFRWLVTDQDGNEITDLTGREYAFYLIENAEAPLDSSLITKTMADGISLEAPRVLMDTAPSDWTGISTGTFAYELNRVDAGNEHCVAYGDFIVHRGGRKNRLPTY